MLSIPLLVLLGLYLQQFQSIQALSNASVALPLSMHSPFLNCWLPQINNVANVTDLSPPSESQVRKWRVFVRIDSSVYSILGSCLGFKIQNSTFKGIPFANITSTVVTPTQVILVAEAGPMQVNLTFINPVESGNWVKQSIPFSYLSLTAKSLDNSAHDVQVFSDINGVWISGDNDPSQPGYCNTTSNSNIMYHSLRFWDGEVVSETVTGWGTLYYATKAESNITYTVDQWDTPVAWFYLNGALENMGCGTDPNFHVGLGNTSFAISHDLGTIQTTQAPIVWAVGYTTDTAINYTVQFGSSSRSARSPYYKLRYTDDESLMVDFLNDFDDAIVSAEKLDQRILQDAASVSDLLGDLVSLAVPQVFSSIQLTIGADLNGKLNELDVMTFMKDVGGKIPGRINAVETLYAAFPALMYIDPTLGTPLLEPLFQLQASPDYSAKYAPKDLGSSFPNVSTDTNQSMHDQGVEQTGNMLIMTYANARASGDGSLISKYYSVLTSWADYLSNWSLHTAYQLDANQQEGDASPNNQTNLAIKGIIAIGAMSNMSLAAGKVADADKYSKIASNLYAQWKAVALGSDQHLFAVNNNTDTWTLGYNLFADLWLGTHVVEPLVYHGQSNFLTTIPQLVGPGWVGNETSFDLPVENINSDLFTTVSGWNLFVAAMTPNNDLRADLIRRVHNRALLSRNQRLGAFPIRYDSRDGSDISGMGSPAQGAMFAPMYGKIPVRGIRFDAPTAAPHVSVVTKGLIGALVALVVGALIVAFVWHRRRLSIRKSPPSSSAMIPRVSGIEMTSSAPRNPEITRGDPIPCVEGQQPQSRSPQSVGANAGDQGPLSSSPSPNLSPNSVPIGLSAKELARIRAETSRPQPDVTPPVIPDNNVQQNSPSPVVAAEQSMTSSSPSFWTMQSQFDRIWREIQRLRVDRSHTEPPPRYLEREGSHHSGDILS